jgi:hypothetical protein
MINTPEINAYKNIRLLIGALGIFLPLLIWLHTGIVWDCWCLQDSISHYFFTSGNVFFEGILWILGVVLIYYPAYQNDKKGDKVLTTISGFLAIIVALVPTNSNSNDTCELFSIPNNSFRNAIHLISAASMLLIFSYISAFIFTYKNVEQYNADNPIKFKLIRNGIYRSCAIITYVSVVTIPILMLWEKSPNFPFSTKYVFWLEVCAIVPFGISWMVKGGLVFTDKNDKNFFQILILKIKN